MASVQLGQCMKGGLADKFAAREKSFLPEMETEDLSLTPTLTPQPPTVPLNKHLPRARATINLSPGAGG